MIATRPTVLITIIAIVEMRIAVTIFAILCNNTAKLVAILKLISDDSNSGNDSNNSNRKIEPY